MDIKGDTITVPRPVLEGLSGISATFADRMHELLDKNSEGTISMEEKRILEMLVKVAKLDQVVTLALEISSRP